jgi:peptidoglycan/xylan/chitin deacetylase (PgdA/CDA1 family)
VLVSSLKRVRRKVQRLRYERVCARQPNPLAQHPGTIVTLFYDVEGDFARAGKTAVEIETLGRILEIEQRCGIRSTYNVVARFAREARAAVAEIARAGQEIASHSYDHSILTTLSRTAIADNARRAKQTFAELGIEISGHRSPQSDWDDRVLDALVASGYRWSAENGAEPYPYRIRRTDEGGLWRFVVAGDDWAYQASRCSPGAMLAQWQRIVRDAVAARRKHVAIGFHAWVEAEPGRLQALEDFFRWLVALDGVRVMPFGDVARAIDQSKAPELAAADG